MSDPNIQTSVSSLSSGIGLPERNEIELPSGAKAQVLRVGRGKHLELAERMAGTGTSFGGLRWHMALIAVKCLINGEAVTLEDVLEMSDLDVMVLIANVMGKGVTVSAPVT